MTPSLPTIVIVPGAWHSPAHFKQLSALFKQAGYPVSSSSLPSLDPSDPDTTTTSSDSTFIREQVLGPLLENGTDILLVMHSYGGSPGSVAARGLSKVERMSGGLQGGVIGLVFIAALLAPEGASLLAMVGGKFHPWVQVNTPPGFLTTSTPGEVFYNDVPAALAEDAISNLKAMSQTALSTPAGPPGWADPGFNGRLAYIRTANDNTIPAVAQDGMMAASGVTWDVHQFDTGHSPFLSQPEQLSKTIITLAGRWGDMSL